MKRETFEVAAPIRVLSLAGQQRRLAIDTIDRFGACRYYGLRNRTSTTPQDRATLMTPHVHMPWGGPIFMTDGRPRGAHVMLRRVQQPLLYWHDGVYRGTREQQNRVLDPRLTRAELRALFARPDIQTAFRAAPLTCTSDRDRVKVQTFRARYNRSRPSELVWSIDWLCVHDNDELLGAFWGVFRSAGDRLVPVYLSGRKARTNYGNSYDILGVGDLDGDGIDELIVEELLLEGHVNEVLTWHGGKPVVVILGAYIGL